LPFKAKRIVFGLVLLLLVFEDFCGFRQSIGRGVSVRDADIEDGSCSLAPESVGGDITSEFWLGWFAHCPHLMDILTNVD